MYVAPSPTMWQFWHSSRRHGNASWILDGSPQTHKMMVLQYLQFVPAGIHPRKQRHLMSVNYI